MEIGQLLMALGQPPSNTKATVERSGSGGKEVFSQLLQLLMKGDTSKLLSLLEDLANDKKFANEKDAIEALINKLSKMRGEADKKESNVVSREILLQDVALLLISIQHGGTVDVNAEDMMNKGTVVGVAVDGVDKMLSVNTGAEGGQKKKLSKQEDFLDVNMNVFSKKEEVLSEKVQSVEVDGATEMNAKGQGKSRGVQVHVETKAGQVTRKMSQINNVSAVVQPIAGETGMKGYGVQGVKEKDRAYVVVQENGKWDLVGKTAGVHEKDGGGSLVVSGAMERKAAANNATYSVKNAEGMQNGEGKGKHSVSRGEPSLESSKVEHKTRANLSQVYVQQRVMTKAVKTTQVLTGSEVRKNIVVDVSNLHQQAMHRKIPDAQVPQPITTGDKYRITDPIEIVPITADEWERTEKEVIVDKKLLKDTVDKLIKSHSNGLNTKNDMKDASKGGVVKVVDKGFPQMHVSEEAKANTVPGLKGEAVSSVEAYSSKVKEEDSVVYKADETSIEIKPTVSENTEVKKNKISDAVEASVHKHVEVDLVKMSAITDDDRQISHEKHFALRTLNNVAKAVEIMKSKHKYPAYMAIKVDDSIVKMKLSFDVEKGEFLLEMMADKDMAKTLHVQKHLLIGALMEKDIHIRDVKVYVTNESSMMGLRQNARHMNWSFMGHNGSWHSYRQQHDYATWVKEVYGNVREMSIIVTGPYNAPVRVTKGAGINIYA